ncbi:MAG: 50S ribosomal protein L25 [Patescibacteria group bacterium]
MELQVQKREKFGKAVKSLRALGLIPAELYGKGVQNLHLSVPSKDFRKVFKQAGESAMINVLVEKDKRPAMIFNVHRDPINDEVMSVDFYQVRLDEKIKIKIPISFLGEPLAVKLKIGILVKSMQEIEVEALPGNLPHSLEINTDNLAEIGNSVYVKDLAVPADVKLLALPEAVVATIIAPMTEEQEQKLAAEVKVEDIKAETEEKKAERAKEAETAAPSAEAPAGKPEKK